MTEYAAGTVAVATVRGHEGKRVMRTTGKRDGQDHWISAEIVDGWRYHTAADVTDVRPLVVLDHSHIDDALRGLDSALTDFHWLSEDERHAVRELRDQIEAQTKPPQPTYADGTIAKVTAKKPKLASVIFAEWTGGAWRHAGGEKVNFGPAGIEVVEIVRPGIEDES